MPPPPQQREPAAAPQQVVGRAVQDLAAVRLGRGLVPLALLFLVGLGQALDQAPWSPEAVMLALGAIATGCAMLAYGQRAVQRAFGGPHRPWMSFAMAGSLVPPTFALYVLGWRGLRLLFAGAGAGSVIVALLFTATGIWVMRSWMKVVEVERLARTMSMGAGDSGGSA